MEDALRFLHDRQPEGGARYDCVLHDLFAGSNALPLLFPDVLGRIKVGCVCEMCVSPNYYQ